MATQLAEQAPPSGGAGAEVTIAAPTRCLSAADAVAIIVGVMIGAGIFKTPALVAANVTSEAALFLTWGLGGVASLIGALCYAELATTYPHSGGDYHYLTRAFGAEVGFLFAWARLAVIQTGSIASLAFVAGDYAHEVLPVDGRVATSAYAAIAVIALTIVNMLGTRRGKWTQNVLSVAKVLGLFLVIFTGIAWVTPLPESVTPKSTGGAFGLAMIFVLFTYGGWNEAAYVSAEVRDVRRDMLRSLLWGVGLITAVYLLVNLAYVKGLGLDGMRSSSAVAADLMRRACGDAGARLISVLIVVTALGATNATIMTGARTNYALGCDTPRLSLLGRWNGRADTPATALAVQGAVALVLILLGTLTRKGFETIVDYTVPVFWLFFLLTGVSLLVLRVREAGIVRPFAVPLYPVTPLLFCGVSAYMLYSSLAHAAVGSLVGVAVLVAGVPVLLVCRSGGKGASCGPVP